MSGFSGALQANAAPLVAFVVIWTFVGNPGTEKGKQIMINI